ncbi:MAG: 3-phosphoshikimate 1-carboxyvinyltransferase, partial [Phycisphaerales bacterium]
DRIAAPAAELRKLGATVEEHEDGLTITPNPAGYHGAALDTYDDHRMAMSLSLIGLRRPNVFIRDPACVQKTYATYWSDLAKIYEAVL